MYSVSWTPNLNYMDRRNTLTLTVEMFVPLIPLKDATKALWADCLTLKGEELALI